LRLDKNILVTGTSFPFQIAFFPFSRVEKCSILEDGTFSTLGKGKEKTTTLPGLSGKPMEKSILGMGRKLSVSFFLCLSTQTVKKC